jgi:hypothetical protein
VLFVGTGAKGDLLLGGRALRLDERTRGSFLDLSISLFVLVVAWSKGDSFLLLSLFTNSPACQIVDQGVMLFICTGTEANIFSSGRSLRVYNSTRSSVFGLRIPDLMLVVTRT